MAQNPSSKTPAPAGLRASGKALWTAVLTDFELTEHEQLVLREACRTVDGLDDLQRTVTTDGVMSSTSQGPRVHPALVELRQQRIALARLFAALHLPTGEQDDSADRVPHRAVRGVYGIRGVS